MRRNIVASTSFRRHVPTRFLINQCQIIAIHILKSYIIHNSRIELRGIVLPEPSNQIKVTFIIILLFSLVYLCFFQFHIEIEGQCRWIIGGGGGKGYVGPPLKLLGGSPAYLDKHSLFSILCASTYSVNTYWIRLRPGIIIIIIILFIIYTTISPADGRTVSVASWRRHRLISFKRAMVYFYIVYRHVSSHGPK